MEYRIIGINDQYLSEALTLVWRVFLEFEAPEYSDEGVDEFKRYIAPDAIKERLNKDELKMRVCLDSDSVVGVIAMRPLCHISLMFVDKQYHKQGIARALFEHLLDEVKAEGKHKKMTVFSSPYAAGFYRKVGFADTDMEQTVNGIRFFPMTRSIEAN